MEGWVIKLSPGEVDDEQHKKHLIGWCTDFICNGICAGGGRVVGIANPLFERPPGQVSHYQVGRAFEFAIVMHGHDVRVQEFRQRLGFALKALKDARQLLWRDGFLAHHLDGHIALQAGIIGFVNRSHTPLA